MEIPQLENKQEGRGLWIAVARYAAMIIVAVIIMAANIVLFRQIDVQLERSYTAESDSTPWVISQVEVEMMRYAGRLGDLIIEGPTKERLAALRLQFDLLYSRANLISRHEKLKQLKFLEAPDWVAVSKSGGLIDQHAQFIDGSDEALFSAAPRMKAEIEAAIKSTRDDLVEAMLDALRVSEVQRAELRSSLQLFSAVSLGLLGVMAALMTTIYLQGRARERHRHELAQAVYNLRTTIDSSLEAAVILDHDGRVISCNRAGALMFSWSEDGRTVRYFSDVVSSVARGEHGLQSLAKACEEERRKGDGRITLTGLRNNGDSFPIEVSVAAARSATGMPIAIAFLRDISEQVEREETLRSARNAALQGEEAKSRFLAVMSHEMRTPLNGLLSAVELMTSSTEMSDDQKRLLNVVESCGKATLEQVNNILELTRLKSSSGHSYPLSAVNIVDLVDSLVKRFRAEAQRGGNEIQILQTGIEPPLLIGQWPLIDRVLTNLLSNAVKFTRDGTITISLDCQPSRGGNSYALRISIKDSGIGIAEEDRDRIFGAFETLDGSYARLQGGTGLGLGLAKLAAEAMGGGITVSSQPGYGSTFSLFLTLPKAFGDQTEVVVPAMISKAGPLSILVVEDNPINRELLVELLQKFGHHVDEAHDGIEGVAAANAKAYDVILMDIMMPRMDGIEATRQIRTGGLSKDVMIVAVTANADPSQIDRFLSAGMNTVLPKPINFAELWMVLGIQPPSEHDDSLDDALGPVASATATPPASPTQNEHKLELPDLPPLIDVEVIEDLSEALGESYMAKMTQRFINETEEAMADIDRHAQSGDLEGAAQVAHKNAGAAASLGLKALHSLLVTYERHAKQSDAEAAEKTKELIVVVKDQTVGKLREKGYAVSA